MAKGITQNQIDELDERYDCYSSVSAVAASSKPDLP